MDGGDLGGQVQAVHAAEAEDTGRGISGHAGGTRRQRIGCTGAEGEAVASLNAEAGAVEINTGHGAEGIGGGDGGAIGLQSAGGVQGARNINR